MKLLALHSHYLSATWLRLLQGIWCDGSFQCSWSHFCKQRGPSLISFRLVVNSYEHQQHLYPALISLEFFSPPAFVYSSWFSQCQYKIQAKIYEYVFYKQKCASQVFSISLLTVAQGKCDSIILNLLFFLPGNHHVAVQYCPSGINFLVAGLQGSIQLQSACSNGMCIKRTGFS